jgi:centromere protein C
VTVRRSTRTKIPLLAHWRGEHVRYELGPRRESGPALPRIKEIVRIDTPPQPTRQPPQNARKRKTPAPDSDIEEDTGEVYATIKAFGDDSEIPNYRVAVSGNEIDTFPIQGKQVRMAKVFQDEKYVASGVLDIVVGGQKNVKPTKHSFMSFAVMWGKVEVKLHRTVFHVGRGDFFVVPRGKSPSSYSRECTDWIRELLLDKEYWDEGLSVILFAGSWTGAGSAARGNESGRRIMCVIIEILVGGPCS